MSANFFRCQPKILRRKKRTDITITVDNVTTLRDLRTAETRVRAQEEENNTDATSAAHHRATQAQPAQGTAAPRMT